MHGAFLDVLYHLTIPSGWRDTTGGNATWYEQLGPASFTLRVELFGNESLPEAELISPPDGLRRAYDVTVSVSLEDVKKRNVTIEPLADGMPRLVVSKPRKPHPHTFEEKVLNIGIVQKVVKMFSAPPIPAWQADRNATAACPTIYRLKKTHREKCVLKQ